MTAAYPLHWPPGFPRSRPIRSQFRTTLDGAVQNVTNALRAFARESGKDIQNLIISANVTMMNQQPRDGGVAVYFRWDNIDCCIAVDRYPTPADNLQAIKHIIEAERTKLRHGGLNIVRAAFRGYAALPPPKGPDGQLARPWWMALRFDAPPTLGDAEVRYRELVKTAHPDVGGDAAAFNAITDAIRQAREEAARMTTTCQRPDRTCREDVDDACEIMGRCHDGADWRAWDLGRLLFGRRVTLAQVGTIASAMRAAVAEAAREEG